MSRLITFIALTVLAFLLWSRWLPRLRGGKSARTHTSPRPDSVICAQCGTEYNPAVTGWMCPKCRR